MAVTNALLYSAAPAAVGYAAAAAMILRTRPVGPHADEAAQRRMIFLALPMSAVVLAGVAAILAADVDPTPREALLAVGVGALVCALGQGMLAARALPRLAHDPSLLGRALLPLAALEALVILPLLWVALESGAA